jgi:hypothetical protein
MTFRLVTVTVLGLALIGAPADALKVKKKDESWGKPGVTLAQYRADANECAGITYRAPITLHPLPALSGYGGMFLPVALWTHFTPGKAQLYNTTIVEGLKHAAWMDISEQLQAVLDQCLIEKGYSRFRLSSEQMDQLGHLKPMSPERLQFLYRLGSDANVVTAQKI